MNPKTRRHGLQTLPHFVRLEDETLEALHQSARLRSYRAGQTIADAGETTPYVGCVLDGFVRVQKTLYDGRQHIVGLLANGDIFGRVFHAEPLQFAIEAATDAKVYAIQDGSLEDLMSRSPVLERLIVMNVLDELDRARDLMIILSSNKVSARLAGFLLMMCTRFANLCLASADDRALEVRVPISRVDLAHLLGTRTESISRSFHALADKGWLAIRKPDLIEILDVKSLCGEAGESEATDYASVKKAIEAVRHRDG